MIELSRPLKANVPTSGYLECQNQTKNQRMMDEIILATQPATIDDGQFMQCQLVLSIPRETQAGRRKPVTIIGSAIVERRGPRSAVKDYGMRYRYRTPALPLDPGARGQRKLDGPCMVHATSGTMSPVASIKQSRIPPKIGAQEGSLQKDAVIDTMIRVWTAFCVS